MNDRKRIIEMLTIAAILITASVAMLFYWGYP